MTILHFFGVRYFYIQLYFFYCEHDCHPLQSPLWGANLLSSLYCSHQEVILGAVLLSILKQNLITQKIME